MSQAFSSSVHAPFDDVRVVAIEGEIDLFSVPPLKEEIGRALEGDVRGLVIDLTGTTFIDSTGLGLLLGTLRRVRERQGEMAVVNVSPVVGMTMGMTGLDQVLTVVPSIDDALARVNA